MCFSPAQIAQELSASTRRSWPSQQSTGSRQSSRRAQTLGTPRVFAAFLGSPPGRTEETNELGEKMRKPQFFAVVILCGLGIVFSAYGQVASSDYPSRPIRLIVPLSPGGLVDTFGRSVAQHFSERLGQPVVVENRPGASQALAAEALAL